MKRIAILICTSWLLGACTSTNVQLMPTPTLFTVADSGPFSGVPKIAQSTEIEVFYATNRYPVELPDSRHYTRIRSDQLHLGVATLQIGDERTTLASLQAMSTSNASGPRPVLTLKDTQEMAVLDATNQSLTGDAEAFMAYLDAALERSDKRDLLIYVHGARTDFDRAAAQAAQFQHFMGNDAVVMVFAWPSAGTLLRYGRDVITARWSEPVFANLLALLARESQASSVDVLAYSAGAMIASPGLARAADATSKPEDLRMGEIYYAAPDIDFPQFVDNLPRYEDHVRRVTVAANMGDRALSFAAWRHRVSRAGRPNLTEIGPDEMQWLAEASGRVGLDVLSIRPEDLPGLPASSHSFWYDHPWVSSDILLKLQFHAAPMARGLSHNKNEFELAFWTFPADYEKNLPGVVRGLADSAAESSPPLSSSRQVR